MTSFVSAAPTVVSFNRRRILAIGAFLGWIAVGGTSTSIAAGNFSVLVVFLIVFAPLAGFTLRWGLRRGPALVFDEHALLEGRSGRSVAWHAVETMRAVSDRGMFGDSHHLVVRLVHDESSPPRRAFMTNKNNPDELDIDLDFLALPWTKVVDAIEQRSGHRVIREQPSRPALRQARD